MDSSYPQVSQLWDLSSNNPQIQEQDFLALLQKQFPTGPDGTLAYLSGYADGVNPQNLSSLPLPTFTPPSEDSSPSPPSNNENSMDDYNEHALKRKASDDDLSDGPSAKTQHTDRKSSSNATASSSSRRKSTGGNPSDENRLMKRKEQNRAAQRAFRERKEKHVKDLEDKVADLEAKNEKAISENENLRDLLSRLQTENLALRQSSFTFTMPHKPASPPSQDHTRIPISTGLPSASSISSPSGSMASTSSHKYTNPLDWSSLTTFDPSMLNLLDDSLPQTTATESSMHLFGFGNTSSNSGLASNAPFTTIASNPMFMSLASTFDSLSPQSQSTTADHTSSTYDFDLNSLSAWPTNNNNSQPSNGVSSNSGQDPMLDDLFNSYLGALNAANNSSPSVFSQSPASHSPVVHQGTPQSGHGSTLSDKSSPSNGVDSRDFALFAQHNDCPKTKSQCKEAINNTSALACAAPTIRKSHDSVLGNMITCAASGAFPKTQKSDKNIEVLSAWRSITSNPKFKDADINDLCAEFTSKARCDGTKVVLEPSGVSSILENLARKTTAA
ncbi:hypothetical protein BJ165DRAFT_1349276 [Panaeolus papilionaceus]|nr:hypothetical protein BJ165DRAFT_1349276 [Panaeolus papilionaceus]